MQKKQDKIYAQLLEDLVDFRFDRQTVDVFADMINRSVPAYGSLIRLLSTLSVYVKQNTRIYDLGCSLGAASFAVLNAMSHQNIEVIAVDNSPPMIERLQEMVQKNGLDSLFQCRLETIQQTQISNASLVMMNLTLQFIAQEQRDEVVEKVYRGLNAGGVFLLTEKVLHKEVEKEQVLQKLHEQFKRENGYSELEISQKRQALEHVLIRESLEAHILRLKKSGFKVVLPWFQALQFYSLLAIK